MFDKSIRSGNYILIFHYFFRKLMNIAVFFTIVLTACAFVSFENKIIDDLIMWVGFISCLGTSTVTNILMGWDLDVDCFKIKKNFLYVLYVFLIQDSEMSPNMEREFSIIVDDTMKTDMYRQPSFKTLKCQFDAAYRELNQVNIFELLMYVPFEGGRQFLLDYLRCVYSNPVVTDAQIELAEEICTFYGDYHYLINMYSQPEMPETNENKDLSLKIREAYELLGLNPNASKEAVTAAYRDQVKKFHPDKFHGMPENVIELARQKMVALNNAYELLMQQVTQNNSSTASQLRFLSPLNRWWIPDENETFICKCSVCENENRIRQGSNRAIARCRVCHTLLGRVSGNY